MVEIGELKDWNLEELRQIGNLVKLKIGKLAE